MRRWNKGRRVERERFDHGAPIAKIDTRPMVFVVMLVVLVLILIYPVTKHAFYFSLSDRGSEQIFGAHWPGQHTRLVHGKKSAHHVVSNLVELTTEGAILWNDQHIYEAQLVVLLEATKDIDPVPELQFEPDPNASYDYTAKILYLIHSADLDRVTMPGLQRHCAFGSAQWAGIPSQAPLNIASSIPQPTAPPVDYVPEGSNYTLPDYSEVCPQAAQPGAP